MSGSIHAAAAPKAVGRYPHARRVGNTLYLSGIGPRDARDDSIPADFVAQCHSVFANVRSVLEASGARWEDLVDVTV
jgi:2-aminomuconate deaminase